MSGARYRAAPAPALLARPLDALTAIYHRPSGRTHVVAAPVPELLALLADRTMTISEVLAALTAGYDVSDADEERLAARLAEMEAAGLVTRA